MGAIQGPRVFEYSEELEAEFIAEGTPMLKKPNPVFMIRVDKPFTVMTNEGELSVSDEDGGWAAFDPLSKHVWPVSLDYVEQHYEPYEETQKTTVDPNQRTIDDELSTSDDDEEDDDS